MSINLTVEFSHPAAIATAVRYARIDNLAPGQQPSFVSGATINANSGTFTIATNIPDGQYQVNLTPVYADGRSCMPTVLYSESCPGLTSFSATLNGSNMIFTYLAPSGVTNILITINYPNGGSYQNMFVNTGNPITVGLPAGVFGTFSAYGQSVCDPTSGFYSAPSSTVSVPVGQPIAGSYYLGNTVAAACAASITTLYSSGAPVPGSTIYQDQALTTPIVGYLFALYGGIIYNLSATNGVLGSDTGQQCAPTVLIQNSLSFMNFSAITGIAGFTYTASSGQNTQSGSHSAFTGAITVSWNGNVPTGTPFSMVLRKNGIQSACNNFPTGSSSSSFVFSSDTYLATDVIQIVASTGSC